MVVTVNIHTGIEVVSIRLIVSPFSVGNIFARNPGKVFIIWHSSQTDPVASLCRLLNAIYRI